MKENNIEKDEAKKEHEPFFIVPSRVFELGLTPYELSVLLYLMMRVDNEKHTCFPSEKGIAKGCGSSLSSTRRAIASLEEKKIISIECHYMPTSNGMRRQTSNRYKILVFENTPVAQIEHHPCSNRTPPVFTESREINKTKPNRTKNNITISTLTTAEAVDEKERKSFLELKGFWFENLKKEKGIDQEEILLLDRALDHLWFKKDAEYEGKKYTQDELWELLCNKCTPEILVASVEFLLASKDPVRSPVAYLGKCILGGLVKGLPKYKKSEVTENTSPDASQNPMTSQVDSDDSSFDVNDFFAAAMRGTYGDDFKF